MYDPHLRSYRERHGWSRAWLIQALRSTIDLRTWWMTQARQARRYGMAWQVDDAGEASSPLRYGMACSNTSFVIALSLSNTNLLLPRRQLYSRICR